MKQIIVLALFAVGCGSTAIKKETFQFEDSNATRAVSTWMSGEKTPASDSTPSQAFISAEVAYWDGDALSSFDGHVSVLKAAPKSPLARLSALRLFQLAGEVPDFAERILAESFRAENFDFATRVSLNNAIQTAAYRTWRVSDSSEPFVASKVGFPNQWKSAPRISPWRLRDFDQVFPLESELLKDTYRSPEIAVDDPRNLAQTSVYSAGGISLSPNLGPSGLYYLETFATVTEETEFSLYGNFPAASKVFINNELVFERREESYASGKRLRTIRLGKGTHRILVKFAYQRSYRDWFDLSFIPTAGRFDAVPISFALTCMKSRTLPDCIEPPTSFGELALLDDQTTSIEREPIIVRDNLQSASDIALYATMLVANLANEPELFENAWNALRERHPKFAAGYAIESDHIETLWQIPSRLRSSNSLKAIRTAHELAPENRRFAVELGSRLKDNTSITEIREFYFPAYQDAVERKQVRNLKLASRWPDYLFSNGWDADAELAFRKLAQGDQKLCDIAEALQSLEHARRVYNPPSSFASDGSDWPTRCYSLRREWIESKPDGSPERIALAQQRWDRYPLSVGALQKLRHQLTKAGRDDEAVQLLEEGLRRRPNSSTLWSAKVNRAIEVGNIAEANTLMDTYEAEHGLAAWIVWRRSILKGDVPLQALLSDGVAAAKDAVTQSADKSLASDDAYFVIDFAARRYFPDGSSVTLTHLLTRVMTKAAIDRYAEQTVPDNARLLLMRTIKQDGTTLEPEATAGKETLSMPGLAEGDFIESAHLTFESGDSGSAIDGIRFYFKMGQISTLHSEYVIIGEQAEMMLENSPPDAQRFTYDGTPAIRFVAKGNPRPRDERAAPPGDEYLPWVQMYREGYRVDNFEASRRFRYEAIRDALKKTPLLKAKFPALYNREDVGSLAFIKDAFYAVATEFTDVSMGDTRQDISHAVLLKEGNPSMVLKALFDDVGVSSDLYVVRSKSARPKPLPTGDFGSYRTMLLRVEPTSGEPIWLYPNGRDAMFQAFDGTLRGQTAVCVSCEEMRQEKVSTTQPRNDNTEVSIKSALSRDGNLNGTLEFTLHGLSAVNLRAGLRGQPQTARAKFVDNLAASFIPGAASTRFEIKAENQPDAPLAVKIEFTRPKFARDTSDGFIVETRMFHNPLASIYASLPQRTLPLMFKYKSDATYRFEMTADFDHVELASATGRRAFESKFGSFVRTVSATGKTVVVDVTSKIPVQRITTDEYPTFRKWAVGIEQSSPLLIKLK